MRILQVPEENRPTSEWEYAYTWIGTVLYRRLRYRRDPRVTVIWDRAHPDDAARLPSTWDPSRTHPEISIAWIPCEDPFASSEE